jgi:hypothetical protein
VAPTGVDPVTSRFSVLWGGLGYRDGARSDLKFRASRSDFPARTGSPTRTAAPSCWRSPGIWPATSSPSPDPLRRGRARGEHRGGARPGRPEAVRIGRDRRLCPHPYVASGLLDRAVARLRSCECGPPARRQAVAPLVPPRFGLPDRLRIASCLTTWLVSARSPTLKAPSSTGTRPCRSCLPSSQAAAVRRGTLSRVRPRRRASEGRGRRRDPSPGRSGRARPRPGGARLHTHGRSARSAVPRAGTGRRLGCGLDACEACQRAPRAGGSRRLG